MYEFPQFLIGFVPIDVLTLFFSSTETFSNVIRDWIDLTLIIDICVIL